MAASEAWRGLWTAVSRLGLSTASTPWRPLHSGLRHLISHPHSPPRFVHPHGSGFDLERLLAALPIGSRPVPVSREGTYLVLDAPTEVDADKLPSKMSTLRKWIPSAAHPHRPEFDLERLVAAHQIVSRPVPVICEGPLVLADRLKLAVSVDAMLAKKYRSGTESRSLLQLVILREIRVDRTCLFVDAPTKEDAFGVLRELPLFPSGSGWQPWRKRARAVVNGSGEAALPSKDKLPSEMWIFNGVSQAVGFQKTFQSLYYSSHVPKCRFFSTKKDKYMDHIEVIKPRNIGKLSLNGDKYEVFLSLRRLVAHIREFCQANGILADLSSLYVPGHEMHIPPGHVLYTTPEYGSFHVDVEYGSNSLLISLSVIDLYFRGWRGDQGTFELPSDTIGDYMSEIGMRVLSFSGNYSSLGGNIGETWIGFDALRHAFFQLHKFNGTGSDDIKSAIEIFIVHISEAARNQIVFNAICKSFISHSVALLDAAHPVDRSADCQRPSWWIANYGWYSREAMQAVDTPISHNGEYIIRNRMNGNITSPIEVFRQIRILPRTVYEEGIFSDGSNNESPSRLETPKECPPDATGSDVSSPYSLVDNWNF